MNATKLIGVLLIIASLMVGYVGFQKIDKSTKEINFLGLKIDASNESGQQQGYMCLGVAILLFAGGIYTLKMKNE